MHDLTVPVGASPTWMAAAGDRSDRVPQDSRNSTGGDLARIGVLIVEDESLVALDMERLVSEAGYDVLAVVDTERDAITEAERLQPDVILMDVALRQGDGIAAAVAIRSRRDVPVVFVSGNADPATLARVAQTQPAGFVRKPFLGHELLAHLRAALPRKT